MANLVHHYKGSNLAHTANTADVILMQSNVNE